MSSPFGTSMTKLRERSQQAWNDRSPWSALYDEAYRWVVPMRRPGGHGAAGLDLDHLFDMTAPTSAMHFAGNLQRDLFPSGQQKFNLIAGPVTAAALSRDEKKSYNRILGRQSELLHPFFLAGDFDTAIHECCVDLSVGTGGLLPLRGTPDRPLKFAAIPFDQLAILVDHCGQPFLVSWKQVMTYDQLREQFKTGKFGRKFEQKYTNKGSQKLTVIQDFFKDPRGYQYGWHFVARVDNEDEHFDHERYATQPIAVPRYYRIPGEAYGRGVVLTALPSIRTVNKAQEIALKSAAIQMLGIWGYRAGGTFNPDTVRIGAGEFWSMQSTGGMLGPDIQRLDPASGRQDVANMLIGNLQEQIREAMLDTRLPEHAGTPRSASEITAHLRQRADVHIGAFGRLVREIMPVVVPRSIEILHGFGIMSQVPMQLDQLLYSIDVQSPMAAALNADRLASIANYLEFVGAVAGPEKVELYANLDEIMDKVADGLQIDKSLIPDEDQKKAMEQKIQDRQEAQLLQLFGQEMAKQAPSMLANASQPQAQAA
ncbi:portal protein [Roseibium album]|uniref:portal protein n=1 Tax=Roseibium album TaxID=311410 RepID=UPI00248F5F20|nr:portal protein [Roseibium album]